MVHLKKQILVKYILCMAAAAAGILLVLCFLVKPLFLGAVRREIWETWKLVRGQDFSDPAELEEEDWPEELPDGVNVVVVNEAFDLLFGSNTSRHYGSQIRLIQRKAGDFSLSPSVTSETGGLAPVSVRALMETEQGKRYVYIYKYTNYLRDNLRFGFRCTAACLALLFFIGLLLLDRLLQTGLRPGEQLQAEFD